MTKQNKVYLIILFLIWPLSALYNGLKNFDTHFGRNLFIALYAFLGFTSYSVGDLERYEIQFYENRLMPFSDLFIQLVTLQNGKFYNSLFSIIIGSVFQTHHYYFSVLFFLYGFFYIKFIYLLKEIPIKRFNQIGLFFFLGILLFLMLRPIPNLAYYTGGVFIIYNCVRYYQYEDKKYLWFLLFAPFFHIGLTIYIFIPIFSFLFKNKTWLYVGFVLVTFLIGKTNVVESLEQLSESYSDTIIETKYKSYASEEGQKSLEERYASNEKIYNYKLKILNFFQDAIMYILVPLGMFLLFFNRKLLLQNEKLLYLFHIVLLFYGISNIMMNVSQGTRFLFLFSFIASGLFFLVYINRKNTSNSNVFYKFCILFAPVLFVFGIMSAYASNEMLSYSFFFSNFIVEIITR